MILDSHLVFQLSFLLVSRLWVVYRISLGDYSLGINKTGTSKGSRLGEVGDAGFWIVKFLYRFL